MSSRDFGWGSSEGEGGEGEKHDFKGKTNITQLILYFIKEI